MKNIGLVVLALCYFNAFASKFDPKCVVDDDYQVILGPIGWKEVNLDLDASEHFVSAYAPFAKEMREMINEVRETFASFGKFSLTIMETFIGQALETLFPDEYRKEIEGIARTTQTRVEDLALLNAFYELTRFCTSIVAKNNKGNLLHGRNLDFGQFFAGWDKKTHEWRLTRALKKLSVNLSFKRNGTILFKGTTFAGHVGLLSGYRPGAFSLTINARLRPNLRNLVRWFAHMLKPQTSLALWTVRNTLQNKVNFNDAKDYLSTVPQIADAYYILGGLKTDQAVILVRNESVVVESKYLEKDEWFLLHTNYDIGQPAFYLDNRQIPGEVCMKKLNPSLITLETLLRVLSSKPTLNKTTIQSVIMSLNTDEYYSFTQNCPDPCWFI